MSKKVVHGLDYFPAFGQTLKMPTNNKHDSITAAAHAQFRLYGYRKTSMEDIAGELGISRASLYSYFKNKDEIFRSVSVCLHERALANAEQCLLGGWNRENALQKIERALLARHLPFHEEQFHSAHADELQDEYSRLCGDVVTQSNIKFQQFLKEGLDAAVEVTIARPQPKEFSTASVAELLNLATAGLKRGAIRPGVFEARVASFVSVFMRGLSHV